MGTVGFVCAMPVELEAVVRQLGLRRDRRGALEVHLGRCGPHDAIAVVTGMGTALARAGTEALLDAEPAVQRVIVVGITGGIDDEAGIGTIVVPEAVVESNTGVEYRPAPLGGAAAGLPEPHGVMWTTDVMTRPDELAGLRARGVLSLDMETGAVAEVCERRGVAWSVVRVVSDGPADEVDDEVFALSNQDGTPNLRNVVRYVLRHPGRIPRLARMGRNVQHATARAASAAARAAASE